MRLLKSIKSILPYEILKMSLDSVRAHKFRSFLTVLGIVVGVMTAIVVASILTGMRQSIVAMVEEYGTNNIYAFHLSQGEGDNREERSRKPLTEADADAILMQASSVQDVAIAAPNIGGWGSGFDDNISYNGRNYRWADTSGVTANSESIYNIAVSEGRFITEMDDQQRRNVMVIGINAAEALFPQEQTRVGRMVRMGGIDFEVIGVLEKRKAGFFGENEEDQAVYIPFRTARKLAPGRGWLKFVIQAKPGQTDMALQEAEDILRKRRNVKFNEPNNFDLKTAGKFIEQFDSITGMIGAVAIAISCLGLLVGGVGVMNIMLVSVTERTKEIGIRKAIGATKRSIVSQFLFEAMTLTFLGGVIGVTLAFGISSLLMVLIPSMPSQIPSWAVIAGLTVSIGVGLIFGVLPARKASRLDPIECLRYE